MKNFRVQDVYLPIYQLCVKKKIGSDISRHIMSFVKDEFMMQINSRNIFEKIQKNCRTFHVSDLVYKNMNLMDLKNIVDRFHNGRLTFSHYCCGGTGIMYNSNYNNKQVVFAI